MQNALEKYIFVPNGQLESFLIGSFPGSMIYILDFSNSYLGWIVLINKTLILLFKT